MIDCRHSYARLHEVIMLVAFAVYLSLALLSMAYQKNNNNLMITIFPNSKHGF